MATLLQLAREGYTLYGAAGYIFKCLDGCLAVTLNTSLFDVLTIGVSARIFWPFPDQKPPTVSPKRSRGIVEMESGVNVVGAYPLSSAGWHGSMAT